MIDPATAGAGAPPLQPAHRTAPVEPVRPATAGKPETEPVAHKPPPIAVDVARGGDGVFVYTLRDPATDTVLAVIPREQVRLDRDGRNFDQRV